MIHRAINELNSQSGGNHQFVISGDVTSADEYAEKVRYISRVDDSGSTVFSDTQPYTWAEVEQAIQALQADYASKQYQRDRAKAYPSVGDQLDMIYHDQINGTTTWRESVEQVKNAYPKP